MKHSNCLGCEPACKHSQANRCRAVPICELIPHQPVHQRIVAGAVTDQPSLKGPDGHLNPVLLRQDKTLHTMVTVGWSWTIIAAHGEEAFPRLPSLIEKGPTIPAHLPTRTRLSSWPAWWTMYPQVLKDPMTLKGWPLTCALGAKLQPMQPSWESLSTSTQAR